MSVSKLFAPAVLAVSVAALSGCAAAPAMVVAHPPIGVGVGVVAVPEQRVSVPIPPGHYPPPGTCRIWVPGVPPGQQSPPGRCAELQHRIPPGAVLVGR